LETVEYNTNDEEPEDKYDRGLTIRTRSFPSDDEEDDDDVKSDDGSSSGSSEMSYVLSDTSESREAMTDIDPEMFPGVDIKGHITRSVAARMKAKDDKEDISNEGEEGLNKKDE